LKTKKRKKQRETLNETVHNTNYGLKGNVIEPKQCRLEGGRQPLLLPYDTHMFFLSVLLLFSSTFTTTWGPFSLSHASINDQETHHYFPCTCT